MTLSLVSAASADLDSLGRRLTGLNLRRSSLNGQAASLIAKKSSISAEIALLKAEIEMAPDVVQALDYLQQESNKAAVGDFEDLLSSFLSDVAPGEGSIHLELGMEGSKPSLDILLDNGGNHESILDGNGGGLTNIVVAGLGYSALSRTSNRQLMLLDEPDCWLKSTYVPNFSKVIAEVSNPQVLEDGSLSPGCQTLMISHNDVALMDDSAHVQDMKIEYDVETFAARRGLKIKYVGDVTKSAYVVYVDGKSPHLEVRYRPEHECSDEQNALTKGFPFVQSISGHREWPDELPGVRWIEVMNVRHHVHSKIALSPGLNVLTGKINGGKSTIFYAALRALAYGQSNDSVIRHGADKAICRLGLENDVVLEMVRTRKGSPKVIYRRWDKGVLVHEGRQPSLSSVPEFVQEVLNIKTIDGLDVQLRSQKEPVFLLNEPATRRAKLLSVGREAGVLTEMMELHRKKVRRNKDRCDDLEIELNLINRSLAVLAPLTHLTAAEDLLTGLLADAKSAQIQSQELRSLVARMEPLQELDSLRLICTVGLQNTPVAPSIADTAQLSDVVARIATNEPLAKHPMVQSFVAEPVLSETSALSTLVATMATYKGMAALPAMAEAPRLPELSQTADIEHAIRVLAVNKDAAKLSLIKSPELIEPEIVDTAAIREVGIRLGTLANGMAALEGEAAAANSEVSAADEALVRLKASIGVCPLCDQTIGEHSH